ncbi:hypothetical protein BDL97_19G060600 [Sphagnum fallax]|nr:hypothetical protein BDL97_19G060600 [Sphagnum fallax]
MMCLCDCEGKNWERKYPCQSRNEMVTRYSQVRKRKVLEPNSQWAAVLQEYSALHRTCMRKVGNLTRDFDDGAGNNRTGCKFLVVNLQHVGIGNKVVLLTSAVLYAILTQRVLLIPSHSYIPQTMCEPFLGSSWVLDERFPLPVPGWEDTLVGRWTGWESPVWKSTAFFEKGVDSARAGKRIDPLYALNVDHSHPEKQRFFCNTEQSYLTQVPWLYFHGCLYFLPKLFAIPAFRTPLEALFPDPSLALTNLLRTVMLPNDYVWQTVKQHDDTLFKNADQLVGIQVRFLWGKGVKFKHDSKRVNSHIKDCIAREKLLPSIQDGLNSSFKRPVSRNPKVIQVLITSLHTALYDDLLQQYLEHETITGDVVRVAQISHEGEQHFGASADAQALAEILLLSFVDDLIATPFSTFGGLAQAYGAIKPWFFETKILRKKARTCVRAQSIDVCYQRAQEYYDCPHDDDVDSLPIETVIPYIKRCLSVEDNDGIQLMSVD